MKTDNLSSLDVSDKRIHLKSLAARFPLLFAFGTTLVAMICLMWPLWVPGFSQTAQILWGRVAISLFAIFMLTLLSWWRETGFTCPTSWRILVPYLPLIILIVATKTFDLVITGIHVFDFWLILLGFIVYMAGGFMEEAIFRGLVLRTLLPGGLMRSALLSSLLFALAHFLNLFMGANLSATILQVTVAFLAGLVFTAPLAITRNIWPLVIIHGFGNFIGYLNAGGFLNTATSSQKPSLVDVVLSLLPYVLLGLSSVWLLHRAEHRSLASHLPQTSNSQVQENPSRIGQK